MNILIYRIQLLQEVTTGAYFCDISNSTKMRKTPAPAKRTSEMKLSPKNQLVITLMRLRQAFLNKNIAYRFGISTGTVSSIILVLVQTDRRQRKDDVSKSRTYKGTSTIMFFIFQECPCNN